MIFFIQRVLSVPDTIISRNTGIVFAIKYGVERFQRTETQERIVMRQRFLKNFNAHKNYAKEGLMASNFKIIRHHNSDCLHLNPVGNLDGGSAMELVKTIEENAPWFRRIFIHTCGLSSISTFGSLVFIKNIKVSRLHPHQLKITGEYNHKLHPESFDVMPVRQSAIVQACTH